MTNIRSKVSYLLLLFMLPLAACGDSDDGGSAVVASSDSDLLNYIPAGSTYVFASTEPWPDDVVEALEPGIDAALSSYQEILRYVAKTAVEEAQAEGSSEDEVSAMSALFDQLTGLMSVDGLNEAGIGINNGFVLYGHGILPVMRIELVDSDAFEAKLEEFEAEAGSDMDIMTIDGNPVRNAGDGELDLMIAVLEDQAVFSLAPSAFTEDQRAELLGFTAPAQTIVDSGELDAIAEKYGYSYWMLGYFDIVDLVNWVVGNGEGLDAALYALAAEEGEMAGLSDVCKAEMLELASAMPRIVTGYTELTPSRLGSDAVFELRSDLAQDLMATTTAVPGLGSDPGGAMSFGMSLDVMGWRGFVENRIDAIDADPYECAEFADLNQFGAEARAGLQQPLPPFVLGLKGFFVDVEDIVGLDMVTQAPPSEIDARIMLAMDNAPSMLAMLGMFSPELAAVQVEPNGEAVPLDLPMAAMLGGPTYIAMNDDALAVSVGEGLQDGLGSMLTAAPTADNIIMSFAMDAGRYYEFIGEVMMTENPYDDSEEPMPEEVNESVRDLMNSFAELYDRAIIDVRATEDGLSVESVITIK